MPPESVCMTAHCSLFNHKLMSSPAVVGPQNGGVDRSLRLTFGFLLAGQLNGLGQTVICFTNSNSHQAFLVVWCAQYHTKHWSNSNNYTSAKYYAKPFTSIISFNPHNNSIRLVLLFLHFLAEEIGFERLKMLARIT